MAKYFFETLTPASCRGSFFTLARRKGKGMIMM
jgi:hypothetical protein